jgi:hypothetical protein
MKPISLCAAVFAVFTLSTTNAFADRLTLDCQAKRGTLFDPYGQGRNQLVLDFDSRTVVYGTGFTGEIFAVDAKKISLGKDGWPYIDRITGEYHHNLGSMDCRVVPTRGF